MISNGILIFYRDNQKGLFWLFLYKTGIENLYTGCFWNVCLKYRNVLYNFKHNRMTIYHIRSSSAYNI